MDGAAHGVKGFIVAMAEHVLFEVGELAFDAVEPGSVGGDELEADVVLARPAADLRGLVHREVVGDDPEPPLVAAAQRTEQGQELSGPFALAEVPDHLSGAHVVSRQQMADAVAARVGGALALGPAPALPGPAGLGPQFERAELVDADYLLAPLLRRAVEPLGGVFFTSKSGSADCFQVLVRWSER